MDTNKIVAGIQGFLKLEEISLLYDVARRCVDKGVIIEIGSWKGKSTICLALGSKDGPRVKVYSIDPHTGFRTQEKVW
jgi:predicted O-methyltransferase YrrM